MAFTPGIKYRYIGGGIFRGPFGDVNTGLVASPRDQLVAGTYWPKDTPNSVGTPDGADLEIWDTNLLVINDTFIAQHGGRSADGRFYFENFHIPDGRLRIAASGVAARVGKVHVETGSDMTPAIQHYSTGVSGGLVQDVTISAAVGRPVGAGIQGDMMAGVNRVEVFGTVDGFMLYGANDFILSGSWAHDLQYFYPDPWPGGHANGTHCDAVQDEGGPGVHTYLGNDLESPEFGTAAAMITQNTGAIGRIIMRRNRLSGGGAATLNLSEKGRGAIPLTLEDNTFMGNPPGGPPGNEGTRDIISDPATWAAATMSGNVRSDGSSLNVYIN